MQELGPNQEKWLQALESGNYAQGKEFLCDAGKYCCLGVACEIFSEYPKQVSKRRHKRKFLCEWNGHFATAPRGVVDALQLFSASGSPNDPFMHSLTTLNDAGYSFSEIAQIVRGDPSMYFNKPA